ncbi:DNA modification methylase [Corallococcus sp. AB032C]|uniref:site-specific DNA-methyltransferase n=1 Tax=Corallococcus sp. AB032C TaxID=2316717 RepID=UPI000ECF5515|nr:site-specific DNA-methyltransferase [Corallococcus sp. AB032C]RKH76983.1 DNA modification methylase [Corallococcus sp. AB032C]
MNLRVENKKITDLKPAPYNPRLDLQPGDPDYEKLKRSIQEFGLVEPIVFNERTGYVVGGHQRLKVLQDLGWSEVPVSVVDLDPEKEKALNVALNKIEGDWDNFKLKELLEELDTGAFDITITGFDEEEIEDLMTQFYVEEETEVKEDNFDPDKAAEEVEEPITKPGDVWLLGRHRLMCGDSTNIDDVLRLMGGKQADMIFTDPPYNVDYEGSNGKKIKNDNMEDSAFYQFLYDAFVAMYTALKEGGPIYVCHADSEGLNFRKAFKDAGFLMKQCLIWVKNSLVLGRQDYHWKHEPILYGWKPGAAHAWYGGRKQDTVVEEDVDLVIQKECDHFVLSFSNGIKSVMVKVPSYEIVFSGDDSDSTTWRIEKPKKNADHPTMKPIALCARAIQNSSKPGELVLDPFGGSGSTLIACEQTGRTCFTMEFDPIYCDVILRRFEEFTGQKAVRI